MSLFGKLRTPSTPVPAVSQSVRPADTDLDLFGITHKGKIRSENQDHFLLCTVHPQVVMHATSLPNPEALPLRGSRLATVMLVADGVGGAAAGNEAARVATETITRYTSSSLRSYHSAGGTGEQEFRKALEKAALEAHDAVLAEASQREDKRRMATTLTLAIAVWPKLFVVQVGDSRCYLFSGGTLKQVTRDQTVGQQLVDDGVMPRERLRDSPFSHVLASALGGDEARPVVSCVDISERGCVVALCSDGLTKHVSDDEISAALKTMASSEQVGKKLLDLALERGGSDNITIVIGRAPLKRTPVT
jgi:serine/threonine protein phosphatase PrpC